MVSSLFGYIEIEYFFAPNHAIFIFGNVYEYLLYANWNGSWLHLRLQKLEHLICVRMAINDKPIYHAAVETGSHSLSYGLFGINYEGAGPEVHII